MCDFRLILSFATDFGCSLHNKHCSRFPISKMLAQRLISPANVRTFCTSTCMHGKRSRVPFDKRFPVTGKHGHPSKKGGSEMMLKKLAVHEVQPTGYLDKRKGHFTNVPEMIPEFIVPDLTDFELKPYVSYKAEEIQQSKMTARDLFQATYAADIKKEIEDGRAVIKDGEIIKLYSGKDSQR